MASEQREGTALGDGRPAVQDHELLRRIGRGSYGEVWLARNIMGTCRAVKVVYKREFADARSYDRELAGVRSFEPVSRSHEGFVDILQIGADPAGKYFYYVMELADDVVDGRGIVPDTYQPRTLKEDLDRCARQPAATCMELGLALSGALSQLHSAGLVHRDIKPANIVFIEGRPKLADIGLVAPLNPNGSFVGTEGFVPPEGPNAFPADLYALGKVLYEMSTGKDRKAFPELPLEWAESPDHQQLRELNEVILRACDPQAASRYRSAKDMHADLAALGAGKSVRWQRVLEKRIARLKRAGLAAAVVFLALGGFYFEYERGRAERASLRQRQVGLRLAEGESRVNAGDLLGALPHYAEALRLEAGDTRARSLHQLRLQSLLAQTPKLVRMWSFTNRLEDLAFSPDGSRLAVVLSTGELLALNPAKAQPEYRVDPKDAFMDRIEFSPDSRLIVASSHAGWLHFFEADKGQIRLQVNLDRYLFAARFSPDGRQVACACREGNVLLVDAWTGGVLKELATQVAQLRKVNWSPDGQWLMTASTNRTVVVWDAREGTVVTGPLLHESWAYDGQFSPDGKRLVTASFDRTARLWELPSGRPLGAEMPHDDGVLRAAFSPDGQVVVTAGFDGTVRLWDGYSGRPVASNPILPHSSRLPAVAFSPDGRRLATGCWDGTIRLWDLAGATPSVRTGRGLSSEEGSSQVVYEGSRWVAYTGSRPPQVLEATGSNTATVMAVAGRLALMAGQPGADDAIREARLWRTDLGTPAGLAITARCDQACISPDERLLAIVASNAVRVIDATEGGVLGVPLVHPGPVTSVALSADGRRLITAAGNLALIWATDGRKEPLMRLTHTQVVRCARFSSDGRWVVTAEAEAQAIPCSAHMWNTGTGELVGPPLEHRDGVLCAAFSRDGRKLATGGEDFAAVVWEAGTSRRLAGPLRHRGKVRDVCFSADGGLLATACADNTVRLWDATSGSPLTPRLHHPEAVTRVALSAEGNSLWSWNAQGSLWQWPLGFNERAATDWARFSRVLAASVGGDPQLTGSARPAEVVALQATWDDLSQRYPDDFRVTEDQVTEWHLEQAALAERNERWPAALFHLDRLAKLHPRDDALLARRDRMRNLTLAP